MRGHWPSSSGFSRALSAHVVLAQGLPRDTRSLARDPGVWFLSLDTWEWGQAGPPRAAWVPGASLLRFAAVPEHPVVQAAAAERDTVSLPQTGRGGCGAPWAVGALTGPLPAAPELPGRPSARCPLAPRCSWAHLTLWSFWAGLVPNEHTGPGPRPRSLDDGRDALAQKQVVFLQDACA